MDVSPREALLASIDETLAAARAALAAGADPEQTAEARHELAARAGADFARLPTRPDGDAWAGVPENVFRAIASAREAVGDDLAEGESRLAVAREMLGGRSD